MPEESDALQKKVENWLQGQGFPLEMRTASNFRKRNFKIAQADFFRNADGEWSDRDVQAWLAVPGPPEFRATFLVECKLAKSAPWVVFTTGNYLSRDQWLKSHLATAGGARAIAKLSARPEELDPEILKHPKSRGYSITQALRERDNKMDHAYHAVLEVARSARLIVEDSHGKSLGHNEVVIPVVVTEAPLFTARLDGSGDIVVKPAEHVRITLRGQFTGRQAAIVHVVNGAGLPAFVEAAHEAASALLECWTEALVTTTPTNVGSK